MVSTLLAGIKQILCGADCISLNLPMLYNIVLVFRSMKTNVDEALNSTDGLH
jgi:hypothetical protein